MANKSKASGSNGASGSAKGKGQQPRSVSQDLTAQRPGQARKGLHLVLQQFGGPRKEEKAIRQLLLWEGVEEGPELEREVELTGLNPPVGQHRLSMLLLSSWRGLATEAISLLWRSLLMPSRASLQSLESHDYP